MHRFYLPPAQCAGDTLRLDARESHHARDVLRLRPGDEAVVLDGAGGHYQCQVLETSGKTVAFSVQKKTNSAPHPFQITLLQAIPKGKIIESIIQKATELGAARIVPILSDRVATRLDPAEAAAKAVKWQQTAIEAIKQSGQIWLPAVEVPVTPAEFIARAEKFDLPLVASLRADRLSLRDHLHRLQSAGASPPRSASVWIGPEGDFTDFEMEQIQSAGALPISLGQLVLRCETAAIYCLSILNHELQALDIR